MLRRKITGIKKTKFGLEKGYDLNKQKKSLLDHF